MDSSAHENRCLSLKFNKLHRLNKLSLNSAIELKEETIVHRGLEVLQQATISLGSVRSES